MSELPRITPTTPPRTIGPPKPPQKTGREPRRKRERSSERAPEEADEPGSMSESDDDAAEEPRAGGSIDLRV